MTFVYQYSGVLAACCALLLIVLPTFFVGLEYRREPISFVTRHKTAGILFKVGLLITAALLVVNTVRLVDYFHISIGSASVLIYLAGTMCMSLVAVVDIDMHETIHTAFTRGYFLLSSLGAMMLSLQIFHGTSFVFGIAIGGGLGTLYMYFKLGLKAQSEYWGIMCAILWVVSFYVM